MDYSHRSRSIQEVIKQLKLRIENSVDMTESELGSSVLGFIWSTDNANELIRQYATLGAIEIIANNMDYEESYQTPEYRHRLVELIFELERQAAHTDIVRKG